MERRQEAPEVRDRLTCVECDHSWIVRTLFSPEPKNQKPNSLSPVPTCDSNLVVREERG